MKLNSAFLSSLLIFSVSQLTMSTNTWAAEQENDERWFEVEVILFKQLGDKSTLKEQFPDDINATTLPQYQHSIDLLTPYFQPELSTIKQFLPLCGEEDEQHLFLDSLQKVDMPFAEEMQSLESVPLFSLPDFNEIIEPTVEKLIEQTEALTFTFDLQRDTLAKASFSTQKFCIITQNDLSDILEDKQLTEINLDYFSIDAIPSKINASGAHQSDNPYLIADESLLLKDISQNLRWSKEFSPLLHFGWRQIGLTQSKATPLKLFAGTHLAYQYQQALKDYQDELAQEQTLQENLLAQLTSTELATQTSTLNNEANFSAIQNKLQATIEYKQKALKDIFSLINQLDNNEVLDTVHKLEKQTFDSILSANSSQINLSDKQLSHITSPKNPLQPWFLDGFLKVHLDHYLYITADFNVMNKDQDTSSIPLDNKVSVKRASKDDSKLINFSQSRRVITGEIHYFDHPYIGMIVQIRRFDPTKPADEAVSQAIN